MCSCDGILLSRVRGSQPRGGDQLVVSGAQQTERARSSSWQDVKISPARHFLVQLPGNLSHHLTLTVQERHAQAVMRRRKFREI